MFRNIKNKYSLLAILLTAIVCLFIIFNNKKYKDTEGVIAWDVISYYGYLPATFIFQDLSLSYTKNKNTDTLVVQKTWYQTAENGGRAFKTSMGVAMMYAPCFLVAHGLAPVLGYDANGYTPPYAFALIMSGLLSLLVGLWFLRKLLLIYYSDFVCTFTLLIVALATNLLQYSTLDAAMSHVYSFCLFSIFLFLTEKWYQKQSILNTMFIGLTAGLISLIRPTNCIVFLLFLLWGIKNKESLQLRWQLYKKNILKLFLIAICIFLVWIPQIAYWKYLTGQYFFYSYDTNERFFFNDPHISGFLIGYRKGWLLYTPTMLFAVIGLGMLWKYNKNWALATTVFTILNVYILASWWCWWYGGSFGMRSMIDCYPVMAIGLATFIQWVSSIKKRVWKISLIVCISLLSLRSIANMIQFKYNVIHFDSMTKKTFWHGFWKLSKQPKNFWSDLNIPDYEDARNGKRDE